MSSEASTDSEQRPAEWAVGEDLDRLFRHRAGEITATLTRFLGFAHLDLVEDVVQEAFLAALRRWPFHGVPDNPTGWIVQVAKNKALDSVRRAGTWREKEAELTSVLDSHAADAEPTFRREVRDDQLRMMFACCREELAPSSQIALVLKTVGGFSTGEIGRAFLTKKATIAQRLVRAKRKLVALGISVEIPPPDALPQRQETVLEAIYLIFNEGYSAASGADWIREDLCSEALRLAGLLAQHPDLGSPTVEALMALMSFQASRLSTRVDGRGDLVLLREQDRSQWNRALIQRGFAHLKSAGRGSNLSRFHLEAEIASCHALAGSYRETEWKQIVELYDLLLENHPSSVAQLNRAVAISEAGDPEAALREVEGLLQTRGFERYYPAHVAYAEIQLRCGRPEQARRGFLEALDLVENDAVRRHLERRIPA